MAFQPDVTYPKNEYIETDTGNKVSRRATIQGPQSIVLAGKSRILPGAVLRGDLRRLPSSSSAAGGGSASKAGGVVISLGRYCTLGPSSVIRPPGKTYRGVFNYYPVKIGDHVTIGARSVVEAAQIGNCVTIGEDCVIGKFAMIKDCVVIADGTIVPDYAVLAPFSHVAGAPGRWIGDLPESTEETTIARTKSAYVRFRAAPAAHRSAAEGPSASVSGAGSAAISREPSSVGVEAARAT